MYLKPHILLAIALFSVLLHGADVSHSRRPPIRYFLGQKCYGFLVSIGMADDPRKEFLRRKAVHKAIEELTAKFEKENLSSAEAILKAKIQLLTELGYDPHLIQRWIESDPKILTKILFNKDNKPVVGYHGISTKFEDYNPHQDPFVRMLPNFYFEFKENAVERFSGKNEFSIIEKYQIPNFGWSWGASQASTFTYKNGPPSLYPVVRFPQDHWLFVTHLKFSGYSDKWYSIEEVIKDGKLVVPKEIAEVRK